MKFLRWLFSFFSRPSPKLSQVVLYFADNQTRRFTTSAMDEVSGRKFRKQMFKRYDLKFVEIDGRAYAKRGPSLGNF